MKKDLVTRLHRNFEEHAHHEDNVEFWFARELQVLFGCSKWENFEQVIVKAKIACAKSDHDVENHFPDVRKMVEIGSGTSREIQDIALTRYACYLIAQNGDPRKDEIAFAVTYFAASAVTAAPELQPRALGEAEQWLAEQREIWEARSDRMARFVEQRHHKDRRREQTRKRR